MSQPAAPRSVVAWLALLAGLSIGAAAQASEPELTPSELFHLRNMCSNAAQKAFQIHWSHPPGGVTLLGFTNHYDVKTHRCYLLVTYREGKSTWFDVSDAQTGKTAAHIMVGAPESDTGRPGPAAGGGTAK